MASAKELIIEALDDFDVEDFVDPSFNDVCADKIIASLEWANFKIVKMERKERAPMVIDDPRE